MKHPRPTRHGVIATLALAAAVAAVPPQLHAFSFSEYEEEEQRAEQRARERSVGHISAVCRASLDGAKVAVIIAERHDSGRLDLRQSSYGPMFQEINRELRALGMRTFTQEEITKQIAQAQIEASFNNDPDAAINAARRLGASFILRGLISSRSQVNQIIGINEVFVDMGFSLVTANGRLVSDATASGDSFAGSDTLQVALHLVRQDSERVVAQLYRDYCR